MEIILITPDELKELIHRTVKQKLKDILPEVIRKASKKEWMNTDEVMEYMKCSRRHIQYLRDSRQLPFSENKDVVFSEVWYEWYDLIR